MSVELNKCYAPAPATTRAKPVLIGGDPKNGERILYCVGKTVVDRSIKDWTDCFLYQEHQVDTTVARYAPSGFYIASADISGKLRIWACDNEDKILKNEFPIIAGKILDVAWSPDSKRIVAVGDGRGKYGRVFLADTGSSVGDITGHSKCITSADFKQTRPYRLMTGSEDNKVNWYEGPPFKFKGSAKGHSRWINCVRFSPDGSKVLSVASDKTGIFYDGKTGEQCGTLSKDGAHKTGIMCCAWSPDSSKILTASTDKTAKIWTPDGKCTKTFTLGKDVENQQLGCFWQGSDLLTIGLNGDITVLDENNPDKPLRVQLGHNKFITALAAGSDGKVYTADYDAKAIEWNLSDASTVGFSGTKHKNKVEALAVQGDHLVSCSMDDTVKITPLSSKEWGASVPCGSNCTDIAVGKQDKNLIVVSTISSVVVVRSGKVVFTLETKYRASSIALSVDETEVSVGGDDKVIHQYKLSGDKLTHSKDLSHHRGTVFALDYSPDGKHLASGDSNREVVVWEGGSPKITGWVFHTARVNDLKWSPDSVHIATVGLDSNLIVWNTSDTKARLTAKGAHKLGANCCAWVDENTVATVGQDCALKTWTVKY